MGEIISVLLVALPVIKVFFNKFLPWLFKKLPAWLGSGTGKAVKGGIFATAIAFIGKIFGTLARFPSWLKGLFKEGGRLAWLSSILLLLSNIFKTPVLLFVALMTSYLFPGILERIFLVVGAITMKFLLVFVRAGKGALNNTPAGEGGAPVLDEFKEAMLDSFDGLPPCMIDVMGYLHMFELIGMIVSTAMFCGIVALIKTVYGFNQIGFLRGR